MPCNGLVYAPPHSCACYIDAKSYGFNALAPAAPRNAKGRKTPTADRLLRGPAYGEKIEAASSQEDWPTFRHDAARSGYTKTSVPAELKPLWRTELGANLSSVVVADGRLFVASIDKHTVHALDADSGDPLW